MALVTTNGSASKLYNPFTGLSAIERSRSGIARAELVYYTVNDDWPATGAGDNRIYQLEYDLPYGYGYVLTDAFVLLEEAAYANATASMTLYPGGILGPQINLTLPSDPDRQNETGTTAVGDLPAINYNVIYPYRSNKLQITYQLREKPTALLYPFGAEQYTTDQKPQTRFNLQFSEQKTQRSAADVTAYVRFLQYDIDQSYNYPLQSPQLTR